MTEYISKVQDEDTGKIAYFKDSKAREDIETLNSQFKDIANLSLIKHTDGKLYIKKQDGTLIGTGVEFPTDVDLSKISMSVSGQTLTLLNNGEEVATVDIPTGEVPNNVVTYEEESGGDVVTAENIKLVDIDNNFNATDVEGALKELFQSASNGKQLIATAITGKGVATSSTDSFQTMATNIGNISTGTIGITPTGTKEITENGTYDVTNFASALVNVQASSSGGVETGTVTPTEKSLTVTIPTTKKYSNVVFLQQPIGVGTGYRTLIGLIRSGGTGANLSTNSNGSTANLIAFEGTSYTSVGVTFNSNNIVIQSRDAGGGGYLPHKNYYWCAW